MHVINRLKPIPLYTQLKQLLLSEIQKDTFQPGEFLPTEKELEKAHSVSRITAKRALDDLAAAGYVSRQPGRGTVVLHRKIQHSSGRLGGLGDDLTSQGYRIRSEVQFHGRRPAAVAARALDTHKDYKFLCERRLIFANDEPFVFGTSYHKFDKHISFTREEIQQGFVFQLAKQKFGLTFPRMDRTIEAALPSPEEARLLGVDITTPMLLVMLIVYGGDNSPISLVRALYRGDRYKYHETVHL